MTESSINKPCELGERLGEHMARFVETAEQEWREKMGFVPVRCATCAFKKGAYPNRLLGTMANATKCVMERETFYCHYNRSENGEPQRICAGWMMLNSGGLGVKAPWNYLK